MKRVLMVGLMCYLGLALFLGRANAAESAAMRGPAQGMLNVNWLKYGKPFDFQRVELDRTGATEVENFVQQPRFHAEETVRRGLRKMVCVVGSRARLEDKSLRVLRPIFGTVVEEGPKS